MMFLFVDGFFTAAQSSTLAAIAVTSASAAGAVIPVFLLWLQIKLQKQIGEMRANQKKNGEKIDALSQRSGKRSTDDSQMVPGEVRELRSQGVVRYDPQTVDPSGQQRNDPPTGAAMPASDQPLDDAYSGYKGAI